MATELELKYFTSESLHLAVLAAFPGPVRRIRMETTYYDTPALTLSGRKCTLRRRLENGASVCTLKAPISGPGRGEWEVNAPEIAAAIPLLLGSGAPEILADISPEALMPICGARFTRQALLITETDFTAEIALDSGVLTGGGKEEPICELEIEFKGGNIQAFFEFCREFAEKFGLKECKKSKFRRALKLATGEKEWHS